MGCISSKQAAPGSPCIEYSAALTKNGSVVLEPSVSNKKNKNTTHLNTSHCSELRNNGSSKRSSNSFNKKDQTDQNQDKDKDKDKEKPSDDHKNKELKKSKKEGNGKAGFSFKLGFSHRSLESEQVAAGWPSWLSAAAGEAIYGWVPLKADAYEKLEKIGQGTYSSVFRAREVETGRILALKKVRFDNFQPESIRFMAREIMILRRLDHPNIMKLEGIITSRSSSSIYLVFEYMEHDLAGLVAANDIKFSDVQIKCYMRQLFSAVEHCHLRGIMHRDIKASNILVNNEGILKLADFGLANVVNSKSNQPLTSRVVTLWYRPPELLMGATEYGVSVDLWSVGCVFAELYLGKPVLKGRTEVEQLHKIFKLCGSPPEDYWKNSKLPHATMFKPQYSYENCLRERCKEFPTTSVDLLQTLLSVEPYNRGTASSALMSEYFRTKPYACDPAKLPKYPPTKEMDAKSREDAQKKKHGPRARETAAKKPRRFRKTLQEANSAKLAPKEDRQDDNSSQLSRRNHGGYPHILRPKASLLRRESQTAAFDTVSENYELNAPEGDSTFSSAAGAQAGGGSGFAWAKRRNTEFSTKSVVSDGSKSQFSVLDTTFAKSAFDLSKPGNDNAKTIRKMRTFDGSELFCADGPEEDDVENNMNHKSVDKHVIEYSGPLLSQHSRIDEHLRRNESHIRHVARRSRFEREAEPAPSR
ncbi:cyclin-dependent kinase C-2 C-like [Rosa rugosa]|uniref:cyclin-dependent kinase C-2 C-like n=1 Tax=Rosa rugosa TaxID=74645 RepID=UPI002B400AC1|nr:cyclin-dependent kinase C-2 C-like [Rosa rugosa]